MNRQQVIAHKRRERDINKLIQRGYNVIRDSNQREFDVEFAGPKETLYEGGTWMVKVHLPEAYPYKSPSIGFVNKIIHPNVDYASGSICLDVINQTWSPMYELVNIFDVFIPQLLAYPNPSDPLNIDAANMLTKHPESYSDHVKKGVRKHSLTNEKFIEVDKEGPRKISTDVESMALSCSLSEYSQLSDLSDNSDVFLEDDILTAN